MELKKTLLNNKIGYIGIDIDSNEIKDTLKNIKKHFKKTRIMIRKSSSKKGYHIIIDKKATFLENILYRLLLGDDLMRIKYDLARLSCGETKDFDLLSEEKNGKRAGKWQYIQMK